MCGGTFTIELDNTDQWGLSPRVRGNPVFWPETGLLEGSIPAWAGEPLINDGLPPRKLPWVYPRVGGGTRLRLTRSGLAWVYPRVGGGTTNSTGLSPRGRGNLESLCVHDPADFLGSIPAWAGEETYPSCYFGLGSIPAWAGEPLRFAPSPGRFQGSIPACAGEPSTWSPPRWTEPGSIPAWAGEPLIPGLHPLSHGLSPRGRGNQPVERLGSCIRLGSIPAWAGEPRAGTMVGLRGRASVPRLDELRKVYPRVMLQCRVWMELRTLGLSPRGRGNLVGLAALGECGGSIPACAGEPCSSLVGVNARVDACAGDQSLPEARVYPRVGGGTGHGDGSIPACAGESRMST